MENLHAEIKKLNHAWNVLTERSVIDLFLKDQQLKSIRDCEQHQLQELGVFLKQVEEMKTVIQEEKTTKMKDVQLFLCGIVQLSHIPSSFLVTIPYPELFYEHARTKGMNVHSHHESIHVHVPAPKDICPLPRRCEFCGCSVQNKYIMQHQFHLACFAFLKHAQII